MCGICGILGFDASGPVSQKILEAMNGQLAHRGPDDFGYFRDAGIGLGHRRLSIIDLDGGRQPIFNEDETVVVACNGEIYNFRELTAQLSARGHVFRTRSDTETIVHAYEEYGEGCVERLRGMFAFALWDRLRHRLVLARDRMGIKPLYYYHGRDTFIFASEIKALLEAPGVPREVDQTALDLYLSQRYVPGPRTMFRNIFKLQPGHYLMVENGRVKIRKYWDIPFSPQEGCRSDPDQFESLLEESVRLHMESEVPLGVFLSGGIDSSTVLAIASRLRRRNPVKTFCIGYESPQGANDEHNEFSYARQVSQVFGAEHHEHILGPEAFRDFIPQLVWHLDEPLADQACIPLYVLSRVARQHITVVLSGEGADEVLGGYPIYSKMLAMEGLRRIPGAGPLAGVLSAQFGQDRLQDILRMASLPLEHRYRGVSRGFRPALHARLTGQTTWTEALDHVYRPLFDAVSRCSALDQMLAVDTHVWLPDDLLLKADKMTMAVGLELRVPFLDHKLVEFASQLPQDMKLRGGTGKVLLRRIMKNILPATVLKREKKGFPVPTMNWLRGPLRDFMRETLLDPQSACSSSFDRGVLREIVESHETRGDRDQEIWALMVYEHWHQAFVNSFRPGCGMTFSPPASQLADDGALCRRRLQG